jgi:cytochrome oxidase assembly protein ShyY1
VPLILITPRWIALHVATAVVVVAFLALGWWQFEAFRDSNARQELRELPAVPLRELTAPGQPLGPAAERAVVATGVYLADVSLTVPAREHDGVLGSYTLGLLQTADGTLPVLRGWLAEPDDAVDAGQSGQVTVSGHLMPPESRLDATDPGADLPQGQIGFIAPQPIADETSTDRDDLYLGYLLLSQETPPPEVAPEPLELSVVEPIRNVGPLQNLSYWALWWIFAGAAVVFWFSSARAAAGGRERVSRG